MTLEYPIMTFSGLSFSNIFSVPKSNISDNDKYMRKLSGFVVLYFRMKKYPINYPILSRTSHTAVDSQANPYFGRLCAADIVWDTRTDTSTSTLVPVQVQLYL